MSLQLLVILVPVIFGLMGFAVDLGRLYLIRGELNQAANAMALAGAAQLAGSTGSADANINNAAQLAINPTNGNTYNFGGTAIPQASATITCFSTLADAAANNLGAGTDCASAPPVFVQASISAPAPLLFWSLLPGGQTRSTTVASYAVAGVSAPLCTGCGIVPLAVLAPNPSGTDPVDWGFLQNTLYTFYHSCSGTVPTFLAGSPRPYVILNRVDANFGEGDQIFRQAAQGIQGSTATNPNACTTSSTPAPFACVNVGDIEQIPTSGGATPTSCTANVPVDVTAMLCGMESRLDSNYLDVGACQTAVPDLASLSAMYLPDTDPAYYDDYAGYSGNGRRLITVAVVSALPTDTSCAAGMTVLGFRQFLVDPPGSAVATFNPADTNGRFVALYVPGGPAGAVAPLPQGWFDSRYAPACQSAGSLVGPGKVVLHQ